MVAETPSTDYRPRRRGYGRLVVALGLASALLISCFVVYRASAAAFTATTTNASNSWTAGALALTDNDINAALFGTVSGLIPGAAAVQSCITVTYIGTVAPSAVKMYVASGDGVDTIPASGTALSPDVDWTVESFSGAPAFGTSAACAALVGGTTLFGSTANTTITAGSMLSDFIGKSTFTSGVATSWSPAATASPGTTKTFRFTYKLASDTPNTAMGAATSLKITWEADS